MDDFREMQLLLYVSEELYEQSVDFYENALGLNHFYGWDEGINDRGVKYRIGGGVLVLLTQENPFPEYGPTHFQLEVPDLDACWERLSKDSRVHVTMSPIERTYGWKLFRIVDPSGNHINVYQV